MHELLTTHGPRARGLRVALATGLLAVTLGVVAPVVSAAAASASSASRGHGTVISMVDGTFGPQLIVGAGPFHGWAIYAITSDTTKTFGCTTKLFVDPSGNKFPCTGPDVGPKGGQSEWPALTTTAAPVAGPGVTQALLGSVYRAGIGHQVTYNGHPLYLFDDRPGSVSGQGWDEPSFPPWHGVWWLVNPDGTFQTWSETLTAKPTASNVLTLSALMMTGDGYHVFPVYAFSLDTVSSSACGAACSRLFPPLLTNGAPGVSGGGVSGAIGSVTRGDGTTQVTYDGHPLYLYGGEGITHVNGRGLVATGSGAGKVVGGGSFNLVTP
jgi:predicted lipoprotein with Yx(FWY)xxD motif